MKAFRIHGRGGQGSVVTAELLAMAAFKMGSESQAFPYLGGGGERRGAPVQAFARISHNPIRLKCQIENPDYVLVQDVTLLQVVDVFSGLSADGVILLNSEKPPEDLPFHPPPSIAVYTFPATRVALNVLKKPIMNTCMLGALAAICDEIHVDALQYAAVVKFPGELGEKNALAVLEAYQLALEEFGGVQR